MSKLRALLPLLLCLAAHGFVSSAFSTAAAAMTIREDFGGSIREYAGRYAQVAQSGEPVVIDGVCASACTIVLGMVPPERVCITGRAVLGFHAARLRTANGVGAVSSEGTELLLQYYPAAIRNWISREGGLTADLMFLHGRQLSRYVRPCSNRDRT